MTDPRKNIQLGTIKSVSFDDKLGSPRPDHLCHLTKVCSWLEGRLIVSAIRLMEPQRRPIISMSDTYTLYNNKSWEVN